MAQESRAGTAQQLASAPATPFNQATTELNFNISTQAGLEAWIYWHYRHNAFHPDGSFKGLPWLRIHLISLETGLSATEMRQAVHSYSLSHPERISREISNANNRDSVPDPHALASFPSQEGINIEDILSTSHISEPPPGTSSEVRTYPMTPENDVTDILDWNPNQASLLEYLNADVDIHSDTESSHSSRSSVSSVSDNEDLDFLLAEAGGANDFEENPIDNVIRAIQHAPVLDASIMSSDDRHVLPQYGLLGSYGEAREDKPKLVLNTNVPFSIFLCGVQGSGKSHTTSCILENSLISSRYLGKLQNPLSALVFSYAQFGGDGMGFTISEAAFLASPNPRLPGEAHVKRVHVLVSPSNYVRISRLYRQLPNVLVTAFTLKPQDLDVDTMLTLMNISGSGEPPLYMAQVTQILREMSKSGGHFDYNEFKQHLEEKAFSSAQTSMLQMRLNLLESFLDMSHGTVEPHFQPGEITIMDMSCPFVDANMACILFRIGLKRYLQSETKGKMIVLDEAHKASRSSADWNSVPANPVQYMLNTPGAKAFKESVLQTIRLQRHHGARAVISTQEPTLLTDLIALCSVTVLHRFSSPEWLSAVRRHIPLVAEDRENVMQKIESLTTGKAMVYCPNAVLGQDDNGTLVIGTSRLVEVSIRKRITSDGGQSVLAV
ncbi:hypothetical protein E8E13_008992 [Curvularia kusanoi]|uniref:Uncharacterized protein n=1 Tax=Curvularia kusanoi TaxID=90978 RepID=A0A9P4W6U8_CURKU|nr:hypothetical protein E8E13_008992 [Curvularia kusanoi]